MSSYILECGVLVIFLYDEVPEGDPWMARCVGEHLRVLEVFADRWNKDKSSSERQQRGTSTRGNRGAGNAGRSGTSISRRNQFPSSVPLAHPAVTLVVSSLHHRSNHNATEPKHISVYVCGTNGWNSATPRRSNACVHIYSREEDPAQGFQSFWMKNTNSNGFKSPVVQAKIQRALANRHDLPADHHDLLPPLTADVPNAL